jgi:hypothetical protein
VESGLVEVKAGLMSQLNEDSHIVIGPTCMGGSSILQKNKEIHKGRKEGVQGHQKRTKGIKKC